MSNMTHVDKANQAGRTYLDEKSSTNFESIIVKFTTWHHAIVYWLKKSMKDLDIPNCS